MSYPLSNIASRFNTGIFSELAAYKKLKLQQGSEVIDLSVGSPDLAPPTFIRQELSKQVLDPNQYGYALGGTEEFYEAAAQHYFTRYQVSLDAKQEILLLMGSHDGLVHFPMTFANPGDLILVPDPGYTAYEAGVNLANAELYPMPLKKEHGFLPVLEEIPHQVWEQAKMMILNFPGNPVPALANREFFTKVIDYARRYNVLIVHDFAYAELVFDGKRALSFLEIEGAKEVGVEFNSLSKSFNMAGCRIGYLTGNAQVIEAFARVKSNLDYGVFHPLQKVAVKALLSDPQFLLDNAKVYERRRNVLIDGLAEIGWTIDRPPATMFAWARVPAGWTSKTFAIALLDQAGVVVTPGNAFGEYGEGFVRIALVQDEERIRRAIEKIAESHILQS
jgi:LL-diaminopimelate aminotransferase